MKKWEYADIIELSIGRTNHSGTPSPNYDAVWEDEDGKISVDYNRDVYDGIS